MYDLPVIKAFCNCPLIPVLQGPMVLTARLLHTHQSTMARIISKSIQKLIMTQIFHLSLSLSGVRFGGGGNDGGGLGTAGNDPLLLVVGRAMILGGAILSLGDGTAARFEDCSASFRRATCSTISASDSPTDSFTHTSPEISNNISIFLEYGDPTMIVCSFNLHFSFIVELVEGLL